MKKINIGIVGGGFNGQIGFIENFYKNKKCKIFGLAEARPILRKKVAKKYKIPHTYKSHYDLIRDIKKFDGIVIVTKRNMIGPLSKEFLKLGKPILTEKPMAGNYNQALKLIKVAKKFKTPHKIGYNKIFDEGVVQAKSIFKKFVKNKKLGNVVLIKSHRLSGSGYDSNNFYIKTKEKNSLSEPSWIIQPKWLPGRFQKSYDKYLNLYCHNLSLLRFFIEEDPVVKYANLSDNKMSIVDLKYKNFNAILETGFFIKKGWDETFEIYFEYGSIKINLPPQHYKNISANFIVENRKLKKKYIYNSKKSWSFKNQADNFISDIIKKKILINKNIDGVKDIKIVENIWKKNIKNDL
jgi:predicted dehydrogenase